MLSFHIFHRATADLGSTWATCLITDSGVTSKPLQRITQVGLIGFILELVTTHQRIIDTAEKCSLIQRLRHGPGSPALRLAEALCELMGDVNQRKNYMGLLESAFMTDRPNGLAIKRRVRRSQNGNQRVQDLRAIVLTPPLLDFLVHRHLRKAAKGKPYQPLSFQGFLKILRERYGLYVDREPPGQPVSQELLLRNKAWLERRLRDLGLLIGVNDAESMKQLKPRYQGEAKHVA